MANETPAKSLMNIRCLGCSAKYRIDQRYGGRWGWCGHCDTTFMLPIPDPDDLIGWAATAPWDKLLEFQRNRGARGHSPHTIAEFVETVECRRWIEQERERYRLAREENRPTLSEREEIWARSDARLRRRRSLEELRAIAPYQFERMVADLFDMQGYDARAVGGTADRGIDVEIWNDVDVKWGVAQCKRYTGNNKVTASDVREFGGAFALSGATHGFLFTTGLLTRDARRTAKGFPWLRVYNGPRLVEYIEQIFQRTTDALHESENGDRRSTD